MHIQSEENFRQKALEILEKYWGYSNFRPLQLDIIQAALENKDVIALLPTGGGKSICFQIPAMVKPGMCIVVTPLIALMKDQVMQLQKRGISAIALHSGMTRREVDIAIGNCAQQQYKFLYLSPERLQTELLLARIHLMNVNLIAIDESHCISQWGYDFRPSYLKITQLTELLPETPIIALTATATPDVVKDIAEKLDLKKPVIFRKSFERKNIAYLVLKEENKLQRMLKIARTIQGSGIVYVRNRRMTQDISEFFTRNGILSNFYHAGLTQEQRDTRQMEWIENKSKIIVCTNAFGMGIDKPDVRFVIHYAMPDCIENYFQEGGRAGRDEQKAYAVLLYEANDQHELRIQVEASYPPMHEIKRVYQGLCNFFQVAIGVAPEKSFDFDITEFCSTYNLKKSLVFHSLKLLERDDLIALTEEINMPSRIRFQVNKRALYDFQVYHFKYDEFIKLLLRSYGGVFDNYCMINENDLAKRANMKKPQVIEYLKKLDESRILSYLPQKSIPQLHFTSIRKDAKTIQLSDEVYAKRKELSVFKMNAMINYARNENTCRSILLLTYFSKEKAEKCGHCDVCIQQKRAALNDDKSEEIKRRIKQLISTKPLNLVAFGSHFKHFEKTTAIELLNWMIDDGDIVLKGDGLLYLNE